jgi:hypothetical protein
VSIAVKNEEGRPSMMIRDDALFETPELLGELLDREQSLQRRDIDDLSRAADAVLLGYERLERARSWLARPDAGPTPIGG